METWVKYLIKAFSESNNKLIEEAVLEYYRQFIKSILDNDYSKINMLVDDSCEARDNIEDETNIQRNKEFYFGYLYACEDIGRRIFEHSETNQNINHIISTNEKLRKLVRFLGTEKAARQKDIAKHLGMKPNELANFMDTEYVKQAGILTKDMIGRNAIYSLNLKGRKFFEERLSETQKNYSKTDILRMLDYFAENRSKSFELLSNESPLLDETIFKKIYHLFINKEIVTNSRQKSQFYINDGSRKQNNEEKIIQDATGILISSNESTDSDTENNYVLAA